MRTTVWGRRAAGIPIAAGILYLRFGILLFPIIAAEAMALSSVNVIGNAPRWRATRMPNWPTSRFRPE
jgi:cation transport ATPase